MNPPRGDAITLGMDLLAPRDDVAISAVELVGASGLELLDAALLRVDGPDLAGNFNSNPPAAAELLARSLDWSQRRTVAGAELERGDAWTLVVGLGATNDEATARGSARATDRAAATMCC
jgi:hypothetical protein